MSFERNLKESKKGKNFPSEKIDIMIAQIGVQGMSNI